MIKGKNLNIFVRFGGLDLKTQKGYGKTTYHAPPATRGFYAMPLVAQELFLVGSIGIYQKGTMPKEPKTYNSWTEEQYSLFEKRRKKALSVRRKQFVKKEGNIWHHLENYVDRNEIIAVHNSWCKTTVKAWQKAFSKMSLESRYGEKIGMDFSVSSINSTRGIVGMFSKDHCEVFIDEKV